MRYSRNIEVGRKSNGRKRRKEETGRERLKKKEGRGRREGVGAKGEGGSKYTREKINGWREAGVVH